jgi:hypothetical protein
MLQVIDYLNFALFEFSPGAPFTFLSIPKTWVAFCSAEDMAGKQHHRRALLPVAGLYRDAKDWTIELPVFDSHAMIEYPSSQVRSHRRLAVMFP